MTQVRCRAIVKVVQEAVPPFVGLTGYRVEAWGDEPHDFVRVYTIDAKTATVAAQEGIRRFVEEMESLLDTKA